ncbi:LOW QUALITY PROTEIN: tetracycline resistance protein, class G-like [Ruditapes philippinarum]|uniref:LOW QUALITY PROTEIN: tetracycline resistance protein, class G-like n=1 Tax=Ruditapes philippinarum TaxID=129788 RepID=UPI00295ABF12|nr:LOW QUALITY PROTEIN: tetracycline resistance protein, class G-like [Ruditapes philippinarum]
MEFRCKGWLCSIPIMLAELIFFVYKTGESMLDATIRPYIIRVVCHSRFPTNDSLCRNLDAFPVLEDEIQSEAGNYLIYYRMLVNFPAIFLGLFCGAWSDKYGRKIPMMLPSLAAYFSVLMYMLSLASPDHAIVFVLLGALVQGSFGKSSVITMAVNSYASDITDKDDRTRKLGKLLAMNFFGLFAGALLAGIFQDTSDIPATFCTVVFLHAVVVLITIICMPETVPLQVERSDAEISKGKGRKTFICDNIRESLSVLGRKRTNHGRKLILILFMISLLNQTCKVGETDITLLFVTHSPLSWPKSLYGYLLSVDYAVMGVCLIVVLPILSNILNMPDGAIVIVGLLCKIIRLFWAGFIQESWMVYVSVIIGSFAGMITSAIRSLMSKSVEENEMGKVFSLLASAETASKLLGTVIFVSLYGATAFFFPGFAYIIEAILYMIMLMIMVLYYKDLKKIGTYDLISAFTDSNVYRSEKQGLLPCKQLEVVDELEEDPSVPTPLPAYTP